MRKRVFGTLKKRKEAGDRYANSKLSQAVEKFKNLGVCNPTYLGKDFCKTARDRLNRTPVLTSPESEDGAPSMFNPNAKKRENTRPAKPGTPVRVFPGN